jgi:hypothetical protein
MNRQHRDNDEEDPGILEDGETLRVPLMLRDAAPSDLQIAVRDGVTQRYWEHGDTPLVTDAVGDTAGLHRPGYRLVADSAARARACETLARAYADAEGADANAWRGSGRMAAANIRPTHNRGGCGAPGHELTQDELATLRDERERAYREVALADENAWRNPLR